MISLSLFSCALCNVTRIMEGKEKEEEEKTEGEQGKEEGTERGVVGFGLRFL